LSLLGSSPLPAYWPSAKGSGSTPVAALSFTCSNSSLKRGVMEVGGMVQKIIGLFFEPMIIF